MTESEHIPCFKFLAKEGYRIKILHMDKFPAAGKKPLSKECLSNGFAHEVFCPYNGGCGRLRSSTTSQPSSPLFPGRLRGNLQPGTRQGSAPLLNQLQPRDCPCSQRIRVSTSQDGGQPAQLLHAHGQSRDDCGTRYCNSRIHSDLVPEVANHPDSQIRDAEARSRAIHSELQR